MLTVALCLSLAGDLVQPATYASPSGEWTLYIDPSSKVGAGPAELVVARGGETVWEREWPLTFRSAVIDDAGRVAGWGFREEPRSYERVLRVQVLSPAGELLLEDAHECKGTPGPDSPLAPYVVGDLLHPALGRYVLRVSDEVDSRDAVEWWVYDLDPAEKLEVVRPSLALESPEAVCHSIAARDVPGTPLTISYWRHLALRGPTGIEDGFRYALLDAALAPVWTLALPQDCAGLEWQATDAARRTGGILATPGPGRFELLHVADGERVTYEAVRDEDAPAGWRVRELARAPYAPSVPAEPSIATLELRPTSTVLLAANAPPASGAVRDLAAFGFDAQGRVRFVREEEDGAHTLVQLDAAGELERETPLELAATESSRRSSWCALAGGDWLCLVDEGDDAIGVWRVRGADGSSRRVASLVAGLVCEVAATSDGGWVALGKARAGDHQPWKLAGFGADDVPRWEVAGSDDHEDPGALYRCQDVAVGPRGEVLVLDGSRELVQRFGAGGTFLGAVDLEETWATEESYLSDLLVAPDGSLLVHDFGADETWHRCSPDGRSLATFRTHRESRGGSGHSDDLQVAPDGTWWTSNGQELLVLDERGEARQRFGDAPDVNAIAEPGHVHFDGQGRVAVQDSRTGALHVYDAEGRKLHVCAPAPGDLEEGDDFLDVVGAADGRLFGQPDEYEDRWLEFAPDGARVGWTELGGQAAAFLRGADVRWVAESSYAETVLRRIGSDGEEMLRIERGPGRRFLDHVQAFGCGADGGPCTIDDTIRWGRVPRPSLTLWSPDGEPEACLDLRRAAPTSWWRRIDRRADRVLLSGPFGKAMLVSIAHGSFELVEAPSDAGLSAFTLSPDGRELWCATTEPLALHRYALPE